MSEGKSFKRLFVEILIRLTNWPAMIAAIAVTIGTETYLPRLAHPLTTLIITYTGGAGLAGAYTWYNRDSTPDDDLSNANWSAMLAAATVTIGTEATFPRLVPSFVTVISTYIGGITLLRAYNWFTRNSESDDDTSDPLEDAPVEVRGGTATDIYTPDAYYKFSSDGTLSEIPGSDVDIVDIKDGAIEFEQSNRTVRLEGEDPTQLKLDGEHRADITPNAAYSPVSGDVIAAGNKLAKKPDMALGYLLRYSDKYFPTNNSDTSSSSVDPSPRNANVEVYRNGMEVEIDGSSGDYLVEADGTLGRVGGPVMGVVDRRDGAIELDQRGRTALLVGDDPARLEVGGEHVADITSNMAYDTDGNAIAAGGQSTRKPDMAVGALVAVGEL